jgi:two-component system sporulation sensor kinase B
MKWNQIPMSFMSNLIGSMLLFAVFQVLAVYLSAMIYEVCHERIGMKQEIRQNEKLKTLGQLAASMAHEVRNPLTVVKGFLQLMRPHENGKNGYYLGIAMGELDRTEAIINDYLFFAKPKLTKIESFSLTDLVDNVISLYTPMATNNGIVLSSNLQDDIVIETDRGQMQQALINLIKNAVEATPSDGVVSVCLTGQDHYAQIVITDNGKGMTKEQISKIGTLFFTTKEMGTGIGTALAVSIIESMNGQITYESELGAGTTVTITVQYRAVIGEKADTYFNWVPDPVD